MHARLAACAAALSTLSIARVTSFFATDATTFAIANESQYYHSTNDND